MLSDLFYAVTRPTSRTYIVKWECLVVTRNMYAVEVELAYEIEMIMYHYALVPLLWEQCEKPLRINRFCIWLAQVKQIESFFEKGINNSVLFYEELRSGKKD